MFIPFLVGAQIQNKTQKGIVRTQSFVNKKSSPIVGAVIMRSGENVNPVISVDTPEEGYFELSMDNLDGSNVYYIKSVRAPKGTEYRLMYPRPNDRLQFTPDAPLNIVMQSFAEIDEYAKQYTDKALKDLKEKNEKEIAILEEKCSKGIITILEKERQIEELDGKLRDFQGLIRFHTHTTLENTDFESLDSLHREICRAFEAGDYEYHAALLKRRSDIERRREYDKAKNEAEATQILADAKKEVYEKTRKNILLEKDHLVQNALHRLDFNEALVQMRDRLYYDSLNVDYLCQLGKLLEVRFNDFNNALSYYQLALSSATQNSEADVRDVALCHNHLGDVYLSQSEYMLAQEHYSKSLILTSQNSLFSSEMYDSYLGLGNVNFSLANFSEAQSYYSKCTLLKAKSINSKAYYQGRIGISQIKSVRGDYRGAKAELADILLELETFNEIDPVTTSLAYTSMIDCMTAMQEIYEAIAFADDARLKIQKETSPKNAYIANILILQGNAYLEIGKIKEGEQCMNEAINIYRDILGEHHPNYASACLSFANYYLLIGELQKSAEMSDKALELIIEKFGNNHLSSVGVHFSKFNLYDTCADYERANSELETIKKILKSSDLYDENTKQQLAHSEAIINLSNGDNLKAIKNCKYAIDIVIKTQGKESGQLIGLYEYLAYAYLNINENDNAKVYIDRLQTLTNKLFGPNSPTAIVKQTPLGQYYLNKGEYKKAIDVFTNVEKVLIDTFGSDSYQLTGVYDMLGDYYLDQCEFERAKDYYNRTYELIKNTYGENHFFIASSIARLGSYHMQVEDFYHGLELQQKAYDILVKKFDERHQITISSRLAICSAYILIGKYDEAECLIENLLKDAEQSYGRHSQKYSEVLQTQANFYKQKGEVSKALDCLEEFVKIREAQFGKYHISTLPGYSTLSSLYAETCDFDKALKYNDLAQSISTDYYGKDNVNLTNLMIEKSQIMISLNRYAEAHKIYDRVKDILINKFGVSCNQLYNVRLAEATLLTREGYFDQALNILDQLSPMTKTIYGDKPLCFVPLYLAYASVYYNLTQYEKARYYYTTSLDTLQSEYGENSMMCINALLGLGNLCISEDSFGVQLEEAYGYYNRAFTIAASTYGANNILTLYLDTMIGQVYLQNGKMQEAYARFMKFNVALNQTLSEGNRVNHRVAESCMNIGYYYLMKANMSTESDAKRKVYLTNALDQFTKAKSIVETINGFDNIGSSNAIAQTYFAMQQPNKAIATQKDYAELLIKKYGKNSPLVANAYAVLGNSYMSECNGEYGKIIDARDCYLKAISIRENAPGNSKEIQVISTLNWNICLAKIYAQLKDYDKTNEIFERVINELESLKLENDWGLYNVYCQKSSMHLELENDYDAALQCLFKAEEILLTIKSTNEMAKDMNFILLHSYFANVYQIVGRQDELLKRLEKAYKIARTYNNTPIATVKNQLKDMIDDIKKNL